MIDITKLKDNFEKSKDIIIKLLINYYGVEYADVIRERLKNVMFDFSSTPEQEYAFLKEHKDELSELSKIIIKLKYMDHKKVQNKARAKGFEEYIEYIRSRLGIESKDKNLFLKKEFLELFSDPNFNSGLIDAFSSRSESLLQDPSVSIVLKEGILHDREEFHKRLASLEVKPDSLETKYIDNLIQNRQRIQIKYKNRVAEKSKFGREKYEEFKKEFGIELPPQSLSQFIFIENGWAGSINTADSQYEYIQIPLLLLKNIGSKTIDVSIIHEMIHKIETNGNIVGISIHDEKETNKIVNETRTQSIALKLARELHSMGIFMYDNPKGYRLEGEATYEALFPLIKDFLDENEAVLSDIAINTTPQELHNYFGNNWDEFSETVNKLYYDAMHLFSRNHSLPIIKDNIRIKELIATMNSYKERSVKNVS